MARLLTCGFEENFALTPFFAVLGSPAIVTSPVHSGTYSFEINAASEYIRTVALPSGLTSGTIFTRFYWRTTGVGSAQVTIAAGLSNTGTAEWQLNWTTSNTLIFRNSVTAANIVTTAALSNDTWYLIEVRHLLSDTVGELEFLLDSVSQGSATGVDTLATNWGIIQLGRDGAGGGAGFTMYYDDFAINDATGSFQNTWAGAGKIALANPGADDSVTWENQSGAAGSFANVDDFPGAADDTNYQSEAVTLNSVDRFGLATLPAEITSDATMKVMDIYARYGSDSSASARTGRLKVWDDGGSLINGGSVDFQINGFRYVRVIGSIKENLVTDLTGKSKSAAQNYDIGYENTTELATRIRRVSILWANVEWIETAPGVGHPAMRRLGGIAYARPTGMGRKGVNVY